MKKLPLRDWLLVGAMGATLFACQSKQTSMPPQAPSEDMAPCTGDDCPMPPEAPYEDKAPCREDECDEQEAGEEAMIHVIEITEPGEQKSEAIVEIPSTLESVPVEEQSVAVETAPSNNASEQSAETKLQSQEASESARENFEAPSISEEPTTHIFDDLPNRPISENAVVLSLEE